MVSSSTSSLGRFSLLILSAVTVVCVVLGATPAQKVDKGKLDAAVRRSGKATKVLSELSALPPSETIPRELIERARAVAVFPDVDRVNILFMKAMKGYGLVSRRVPGGWSMPAFYAFAVSDTGWTKVKPKNAGIIMLIMDEGTLKRFEKDHIQFEAAAGPVGELTTEGKKAIREVGFYIYGMSDGKLHGIEVKDDSTTQSGINSDNKVNKAVYGLKAREVMWSETPLTMVVPPEITEFQNVLTSLSRG
jgi:lipid-binding SYLF domain-containing protein